MKNIIFLIISIFGITTVFAQTIQVKSEFKNMSAGQKNAFVLQLDNAKKNEVEQSFKTHVAQYGGKVKQKNGETIVDNATIKTISDKPVTVYSTAMPSGSGVKLYVWVDLGGRFASPSEPQYFTKAQNFVRLYGVEEARKIAKAKLLQEENKLKTRETELITLERNHKNYELTIAELEAQIQRNKSMMAQNQKDQLTKKQEIANQKTAIDQARQKLNSIN